MMRTMIMMTTMITKIMMWTMITKIMMWTMIIMTKIFFSQITPVSPAPVVLTLSKKISIKITCLKLPDQYCFAAPAIIFIGPRSPGPISVSGSL